MKTLTPEEVAVLVALLDRYPLDVILAALDLACHQKAKGCMELDGHQDMVTHWIASGMALRKAMREVSK